ncbi:MAG: glycerol kinase GlpK [Bryobacterales bacterium]|nr:glycerol kinase GlpK [Bryobacterales bacterium]MDE0622581.1 glycerol kinase GlpK [Bryobacterales bacterium]
MSEYVLALDEGTSSARAIAFDREARARAVAQHPFESRFPHSGWVEQDAAAIWRVQLQAASEVAEQCGGWGQMSAIGITNQRETTIVWDRATGEPVGPAIVWQCRRTSSACSELAKAGHGQTVTQHTGLVLDPYFSGTKIAWLLDNVPDARRRAENGELAFGTVDSWLVYQLTNGKTHVIDRTNASRTLLMNLRSGSWDPEMLSLLGVPAAMLPTIVPSCGTMATTSAEVIGAEIPISGIAGDQQAALFGQACFRPGLVKNTYGTGCFALMHTGAEPSESKHKLLSTTAASAPGRNDFALEGAIFVAGAVVQWLRDELALIDTAADSQAAAQAVADTAGVYMVPAFTGLGAPYWNSEARGILTGLTRGATREHVVRAALESIAYQTRDLVEAMESDCGSKLAEIRVDGGATENDFLMQFQADILGVPVVRPAYLETTALGAAFLAGLATGFWSDTSELEHFWSVERTFEPSMPDSRRADLYAGWKSAVRRAL